MGRVRRRGTLPGVVKSLWGALHLCRHVQQVGTYGVDQRPDPDALLTRVQAEEAHRARGKLKIFFGAAAGVGKTYAMLEASHARRAEGVDVVVGWVETPGHRRFPDADRDRVVQTLRLAEQLGAETATLSGQNVSAELLSYARTRNMSEIVIGKPIHPRWRDVVFGSVVDELTRRSDEIDIYVISGEEDTPRPPVIPVPQVHTDWRAYGLGNGRCGAVYGVDSTSNRLPSKDFAKDLAC